MRAAKPLAALALTAAGSALVVGFQVPEAGVVAVTDTATGTTSSAAASSASEEDSTGSASGATDSGATDSGATDSGSTDSGSTDSGSTASGSGSMSLYADGTYDGAAVDEPWGTFKVQAVISGGQLVDVTIVSAPTDRHSSRINNSSIPTLTSQALASQSADVDVISGATWTSESYATSLQAALDSAEAALDAAA